MMRKIAIGLAVATIAVGGSTLSASALHGQKSTISKGSMSKSVKGHRFGPHTYAYEGEERGGRGYDRRYDRLSRYEPGGRYERMSRYEPGRFDRGIARYERNRLVRLGESHERRLERLERLARLYEREQTGRYYEPRRYERFGRLYERERTSRYYEPGRYERLGRTERERLGRPYDRGERYNRPQRYERPYGYYRQGYRYGYRATPRYYGRR